VLHLRLLALAGLDGAHEAGLRLRTVPVACHVDEGTTGHPRDVLLLPCREVA
jgi:hypothetical protein